MYYSNKVVLILSFLTAISCTIFDHLNIYFKIHRLERCTIADKKFNIQIKLQTKILYQNGSIAILRARLILLKKVEINFRLSVHGIILTKGENDLVGTHKFIRSFGYICKKLKVPKRPWVPFLRDQFECPVANGTYDLGAVVLDVNSFKDIEFHKDMYAIYVYGYSGSDVIFCTYSVLEFYDKDIGMKEPDNR